ncbi:MAG: hypothetical protein WKF60_05040 [Ilumatobacter sp.]
MPEALRERLGDERVEQFVVDRAEQRLDPAVRVDDRKCRLRRDAELAEDGTRVVADLGECQVVLVDEVFELRFLTAPGDADELGLSGPAL